MQISGKRVFLVNHLESKILDKQSSSKKPKLTNKDDCQNQQLVHISKRETTRVHGFDRQHFNNLSTAANFSNVEDFEIKPHLFRADSCFDEESKSFASSENEMVNVEDDDILSFVKIVKIN